MVTSWKASLSQGCGTLEAGTHLSDWTLRGYILLEIHLLKENDSSNSERGFVLEEALSLLSPGHNVIHSQDSACCHCWLGWRPSSLPCNTTVLHSPHSPVVTSNSWLIVVMPYICITVKASHRKLQSLANISNTTKSNCSGSQPPVLCLQRCRRDLFPILPLRSGAL